MPESSNRPLRVFLCHSSNDKPLVRELYRKLCAEEWIKPWLDEEELYPGQDWNFEIERAVEAADAILVCLSNNSITKEGYVQRELRIVLDYADYKPEGTLYIIPVRLEECEPPRRLRAWQYADYFPEDGRERAFQRLLVSLKRRADSLGLKIEPVGWVSDPTPPASTKSSRAESLTYRTHAVMRDDTSSPMPSRHAESVTYYENKITLSNGMEFMCVPAGPFLMGSMEENKLANEDERPQHAVHIPYDYWMARYPVTNELYNVYVKAEGMKHPEDSWEKIKQHPVMETRFGAKEYCQWLNNLLKSEMPADLILRLPTEAEWEKAARGTNGNEWPWGNEFDESKCNSSEGGKGGTTPVGLYSPRGDSLYGCADMAGNVWEWTHSLYNPYPYKAHDGREEEKVVGGGVQRGGCFYLDKASARCAARSLSYNVGFRLVIAPPIEEIIKLSD